jgi:hypothetical protein
MIAPKRPARRAFVSTPILFIVGFNLFTLAVFVTAPLWWDTDNLRAVCLLVLLCQLLIFIGFQLGRRSGSSSYTTVRLPLGSGRMLMRCFMAIYPLTALIGYAYRMGHAPWDVRGMYTLLWMGVLDRSLGYEMALRGTGLGPIPWRVYLVASIVNQCFFIAGFIQWKRMGLVARCLFAVFLCAELFFAVGRGTAFGVVTMVTTFFLSTMLWRKSARSRAGAALGSALLVALLFLGSVAFFSYNLYSRSKNVERGLETFGEFKGSYTILDHWTLTILPEALRPSYMNVVSYLAQGYYHASLAMDLEFQTTFLLGNNPALMGLAELYGIDVWNRTYMHRLQAAKGISELGVWHSAYTWYACDVSYYGVPFILLGLGYLFGFSWSRARKGDFLSGIMFIMFGNMLLFLFANNTYLSSVFYSFMVLVPLWIVTRTLPFVSAAAIVARHRARAAAAIAGPKHSDEVVR